MQPKYFIFVLPHTEGEKLLGFFRRTWSARPGHILNSYILNALWRLNKFLLLWLTQAFLDAFPGPRDPKSADFSSFHLEFWHIFHVFLIKLVIFHTNVRKFEKSADLLGFRLDILVFSLSFEGFFCLDFFSERPKKAWVIYI